MGRPLDALIHALAEELSRSPALLSRVYHAGKTRITKIDPKKLQRRDAGYYGEGFYVADSAEFVRKWYGPVVTCFLVSPTAKILHASVDAAAAPAFLVTEMQKFLRSILQARGYEDDYNEQWELLRENQLEWVHLVDTYAKENKYDIVVFNSSEILIKNPNVLSICP